MKRQCLQLETPSPGLQLGPAYKWHWWKKGYIFAASETPKVFFEYWRGDIWWLTPPMHFNPEWLNEPKVVRNNFPESHCHHLHGAPHLIHEFCREMHIKDDVFPQKVHAWLAIAIEHCHRYDAFHRSMMSIDLLLAELGTGPSREGDVDINLMQKELNYDDRYIFRYAMDIYVKRIVSKAVNPKWQGKKMIHNHYYTLALTNTLPKTEKAHKASIVAMLDMYHKIDNALRNTTDYWGACVDIHSKRCIFNALSIDPLIIGGKPMTLQEFDSKFHDEIKDTPLSAAQVEWYNKVRERYQPIARYSPHFHPRAFMEVICSPFDANQLLFFQHKSLKEVTKSFCTGLCGFWEFEGMMKLINKCDPELVRAAHDFQFVGPWACLGFMYHLRSLARHQGQSMEFAESVRTEMELLVGRAKGDGGGQLHTLKSAFETVVKKHFPPFKGRFINSMRIRALSKEGKSVFIL